MAEPDQLGNKKIKRSPIPIMSHETDDILLEILLSSPDSRTAVQRSLVCKKWCSVIFSDIFVRKFSKKHHHHYRRYLEPTYALPFTIFLNFKRIINDTVLTSHTLSSESPAGILTYTEARGYLEFLPDWSDSTIETSCDDLLLISLKRGDSSLEYCVCDPPSKKWNNLLPLTNGAYQSGLWCDPDQYSCKKGLGSYKVVIVERKFPPVVADVIGIWMFSSTTGVWEQRDFTLPTPRFKGFGEYVLNAITSKGVVYFPMGKGSVLIGFLALNPITSNECSIINLPDGLPPCYDFGL